MLWIETKTIDDAKQVYERTWGIVSHKTASGVEFNVRGENLFEDGVFWADAIKKIRNDPYDRLALAKRNLPLPAAFRETAISLRAIIRHQRKQMLDYGNPLKMLYRWAAIWSFYIPYAPRIKRRGYDVMARIPFSEFESMPLTWHMLGCDELQLLTNMDRNRMREAWGEPEIHTTAHLKYLDVWKRYERILTEQESIKAGNFK